MTVKQGAASMVDSVAHLQADVEANSNSQACSEALPHIERFSKAAKQYKRHDVLQRLTAARLQKNANLSGCLLDVGAGPGTCFAAFSGIKQVTALDIAQGMLDTLSLRFKDYRTVCCDVQQIKLDDEVVDTIYSNLALQWCTDLPRAAAELARVSVRGAECHLSIVAAGSLPELKTLGFRTNSFMNLAEMIDAFLGINQTENAQVNQAQPRGLPQKTWQLLDASLEHTQVYFNDLRSMLYSIKGVGASAQSQSVIHAQPKTAKASALALSSTQLMSKSQWQHRRKLAETMRTEQGLPLTYQIAYLRLKLA
ncbi:Methyltransferase type 11 [Shewanella denitrificans OS217]|uniref:Methyltransferase type 11 n=2 Tax=Shewanella TaxID=22 RepID=Q12NN2_SHEDO|nr:Methyltransferase type 11 [Shewanella denitrificans OS217]